MGSPFAKRLLQSSGLHAAAIVGLALGAGHVAGSSAGRMRSAEIHIERPFQPSFTSSEPEREERPLDEEAFAVEDPRPTPAVETIVEAELEPDPPLEALPDAESLWPGSTRPLRRESAEASEAEITPSTELAEATPAQPPATPPSSTPAARGAEPIHAPPPAYPRTSQRLGEEGVVVCELDVSESGEVRDVRIVESSGYPRLDRAAREALLTWRFAPASEGGRSVSSAYPHRVVFRLGSAPS